MRAISPAWLLAVALVGKAEAQNMTPILPGVMCEDGEALGQLTQNDGSSRSDARAPQPETLAARARGGCRSPFPGNLVARRKNTSIITADPQDGKGARKFFVPNIIYSLTDNLQALRVNPAITNLPKDCATDFDHRITVEAIIRSDLFAPETGKPYRYHYLFFPDSVCVEGDIKGEFTIANAVSLKPMQPVSAAALADGRHVTVVGKIGVIDAGLQPLTLDFLADSVTPH